MSPSKTTPSADAAHGAPWKRPPFEDIPTLDAPTVLTQWQRLHAGQGRFAPPEDSLAEGWAAYHAGDFERAATVGLAHGGAFGLALADRAAAIYANYLEPREAMRLSMFRVVAERAAARARATPDDVQAHYWHAYALGRYSQRVSVTRALAQGLGERVKGALERVLALDPDHADAHLALGSFHAEVIDKVGALVGRMTYGARPEIAVACFERALALNPHAPIGPIEYAQALRMLFGESRHDEAMRLLERAAACTPADARERLDVEFAREALGNR